MDQGDVNEFVKKNDEVNCVQNRCNLGSMPDAKSRVLPQFVAVVADGRTSFVIVHETATTKLRKDVVVVPSDFL